MNIIQGELHQCDLGKAEMPTCARAEQTTVFDCRHNSLYGQQLQDEV